MAMSATLAVVPITVCTRPESASTPMCAFMPKCQTLPFFVCVISGSRLPSRFLVELGAAIKVASTSVPWRSSRPFSLSRALTSAKIASASPLASSRWRKLRMVVSSGIASSLASMPAKACITGMSCSASSIPGSDRANHCCMKWIRSIIGSGLGGRPPLAPTFGRVVRFDERTQPGPWHDAIHVGQKELAARRLRLRHETRFGQAHLFHRSVRSCRGVLRITHQHRVTSTGFSENP